MNTREARVLLEKISYRSNEMPPPILVTHMHGTPLYTAHPGHDSHAHQGIKQPLHLFTIVGWETAVMIYRRQVWKDILNTMTLQYVFQSDQTFLGMEKCLARNTTISQEPIPVSHPSVLQPHSILTTIIASITHIFPWDPELICGQDHCN